MAADTSTVEKWFLRSRRLAAAALPLAVAVGALFDLDPAVVTDYLVELGDRADQLVAAALSLWASGAALWSWIRPDHAQLKLLPGRRDPGAGAGGSGSGAGSRRLATVGLVALTLACATTTPHAERLWLSAHRAYHAALERDNALVQACLEETADEEACEPAIPPETRADALEVIARANRLLDELARLEAAEEPDAARADALLAELETLALELALRQAHR